MLGGFGARGVRAAIDDPVAGPQSGKRVRSGYVRAVRASVREWDGGEHYDIATGDPWRAHTSRPLCAAVRPRDANGEPRRRQSELGLDRVAADDSDAAAPAERDRGHASRSIPA